MHWKKLAKEIAPLVYAAILIFVVILVIHNDLNNLFNVEEIRDFIKSTGALSVFAFMFVMILFSLFEVVPLFFIYVLGGFLFGMIAGALYSISAMLIGSSILFKVIKKYGHKRFIKKGKHKELNYLKKMIKKDAVYALYIARLIPIFPNELIAISASLSDIRFKDFILIMLIGALPYGFIAASLGDSFTNPTLNLTVIIFSIITSAILSVILFKEKVKKRLIQKQQ